MSPDPAGSARAAPAASVVIPVRDGAERLEAVLGALDGQELDGDLEVIVIDSGSTDGSVEIAERHGARLIRIAARSFDHGETRNLGAREARAPIVVFLSQDAVPADRRLVAALVGALVAEPRAAGAFARQVPWPDADPLTRRDLGNWVASGDEPRFVLVEDQERFAALPPLERYRLSAFDDVAAAVRRALLLEHPFPATRFGEDLEWSQRMLGLGYGLSFVPEAVVIHSHRRQARRLFRRNYLGHRLLFRLFGLRTVPDLPHLLRAFLGALKDDLGTLKHGRPALARWLAVPLEAWAATYGQYRGGRDEALGRPYPGWA